MLAIKQLTNDKILIHSKNSLQLFTRKHTKSYSWLLKEQKMNENYHVTFHILNNKLVLTIIGTQLIEKNMIQVYNEFLQLQKSRSFDHQINTVCLNDTEIICWSSKYSYFSFDYNLNKKSIDLNYKLISGAIKHVSKDRIYFTDNVSNSLVILNRGIDG